MDPNVGSFNLDIKFLSKLIETCERGVGALFAPWQRVRMAKADAKATLIQAQADHYAEEIRAGLKQLDESGKLIAAEATVAFREALSGSEEFDFMAQSSESQRTSRRARNLVSIVRKAAEDAQGTTDDQVSDEPVDPDWFARWRASAEDVSSDQLQQLWARILSGEIKQPGSISLRTLEFMKCLSTGEARLIEVLGNLVIDQKFVFRSEYSMQVQESVGLHYDRLRELHDLGILDDIHPDTGPLMEISSNKADSFQGVLIYQSKAVVITDADSKKILKVPVLLLTRLGIEMISLGRFSQLNQTYLNALTDYVKSKNFGVRVGDWRPTRGTIGKITNLAEV